MRLLIFPACVLAIVVVCHAQLPPGSVSPQRPAVRPPPPSPPPATPLVRPTVSPSVPVAEIIPDLPVVPVAKTEKVDATARINEILRIAGNALVFVEGGDGSGSGFLCKLGGKTVLITNQHVIRGNAGVKFTTLDQSQITVGAARVAVGHDVIAYDVRDAAAVLEVETNTPNEVAVGDDVVVLGNTEGARVIKPLAGRVVGTGPNLVEISSEFLPGNSGSPIIHLRTGKVIGVATYAIVRDVNSLTGQREANVRRFGYRLDSIQNWVPVNWAIYQGEASAVKKVGEFSVTLVRLLLDLRRSNFDATRHTDSRLRTALSYLSVVTTRNQFGEKDRVRALNNFLGELRNVSQRDVDDLRPRLRYDFFQRELTDESKFRTDLHKGLGDAMQKLR